MFFFSSPINLIPDFSGVNPGILELDTDYEPVFYTSDGFNFTAVTVAPTLPDDLETEYFLHIDPTIQGTIEAECIEDDITTKWDIDLWIDIPDGAGGSWDDQDGDMLWDNGEAVNYFSVNQSLAIEGYIDVAADYGSGDNYLDYYAPGSQPVNTLSDLLAYNSMIEPYIDTANGSTVAQFLVQIANDITDPDSNIFYQDFSSYNPFYNLKSGDNYYISIGEGSAFMIWHSLTAPGTIVNIDGTDYVSTGSFWSLYLNYFFGLIEFPEVPAP